MIAKSAKTTDFGKNRGFQKLQMSKFCGFLCEMKDDLSRKVTLTFDYPTKNKILGHKIVNSVRTLQIFFIETIINYLL